MYRGPFKGYKKCLWIRGALGVVAASILCPQFPNTGKRRLEQYFKGTAWRRFTHWLRLQGRQDHFRSQSGPAMI